MARLIGHRSRHDPFVRIERELMENPTLSLKAKALYGWLLDKGTFPGGWDTDTQRIAAITSDGLFAIRAALIELEEAGLLVRTDAKSGGRGKRAEWHVYDEPKPTGNREVLNAETASTDRGNRDAHLITERLINEPNDARALVISAEEEFTAFWKSYPRKIAKPTAIRAYMKARKSAECDTIMAGVTTWAGYWAARNEPEFVPHPATWLNQQRWNDMPPRSVPKSSMAKFNAAVAAEQQFITTTATEETHDTQRDERSDPHPHRVLRGAAPTTEVG